MIFKKLFKGLIKKIVQFLNWLFLGKSKQKNPPPTAPLNPQIRTIGDRRSGKTTYIAALAYWPNAKPNSPVQTIEPIDDNAKKLIAKAQNILEQGEEFQGTNLQNIDEVEDYVLQISLKKEFTPRFLSSNQDPSSSLTITIYCKDYSGEFFSDLINDPTRDILEEYLEDCSQADGIILLIDGTSFRRDRDFARGIEEFFRRLDQIDETGTRKQRRVAMVFNKCEQPELWIQSDRPRQLAESRFPKVLKALENWEERGYIVVDYFAASAFGMLGSFKLEPNVKNIQRDNLGVKSIIQKPKQWRPFGLVAPLYWLASGHRHPQLELDALGVSPKGKRQR